MNYPNSGVFENVDSRNEIPALSSFFFRARAVGRETNANPTLYKFGPDNRNMAARISGRITPLFSS